MHLLMIALAMLNKNFLMLRLLKVLKNLGYAGGCNLGAKAKNEYLIFLNNDTVVENGWDEMLILGFDNNRVSSVQPKIKNLLKKINLTTQELVEDL